MLNPLADGAGHTLTRRSSNHFSLAGSCVWHFIELRRSVREWAHRQGWGGRRFEQTEAGGILITALGILAAYVGYGEARRASGRRPSRCR
jgi:hypothetical protein